NTPFPTPTATPRSHTVQRGEDMFGIAWQYGITLAELQAANPDVNPNILSVDTVLIIPPSSQITPTPDFLPSPTPAGAVMGQTVCHPAGDGGIWCFIPIANQSSEYIEGVSLDVRLGSQGAQVAVGSALTAQNLIPPGAVIPAAVYFPPPVPQPYDTDAVLITSLPVVNLSERYLSAGIENLATRIADDGQSAAVQGTLVLRESGSADLVSVAVIAYNAAGQVVGFRRWESSQPGSTTPFTLQVYSLADEIAQVSVFAEARR
ncbi:MAG: LysM domain-containing protein, partial [Anaerolineaceae bacterium]